MLVFNKYFYKNKKSKLYFGDRVAVLNDFIYQTGGSTIIDYLSLTLFTELVELLFQLEACAHSFFDELREPHARLPNGRPFPPLFNFKQKVSDFKAKVLYEN
jgi:hypothetical protein